MSKKQAYKANIQMNFVSGNESISIDPSKIIYIIIDHQYEGKVMPVIYTSISVNMQLYSRLIDEKEFAKIYLRVQKYDIYSTTSLSKDYIKGQFTYFLPTTTPNYSKDLSEANTNMDSSYVTIVMGLLDMGIMNTLRKSFGGIKKNIDQHTLVYRAMEDTKAIIKTPTYNLQYSNLIIPALSSRKKYLDFLFNTDPFYDTEFMYFIDFDRSYLLDRSGEAISANDGQLDDILIDIKSVVDYDAYSEGMEIRNGSYYFIVNPANTNISLDTGTEKVANQLVAGDDKSSLTIDLNINKTVDSTTKQTFKRMDSRYAIIYKNAVESSQVVLEFVKENIDSRYITPNKCFTVSNYDEYSIYDGIYTLLYKKEVIRGTGIADDFTCALSIGLKKLGNIQHIGKKVFNASASNSKTTRTTAKTNIYSTKTTRTTAANKATTISNKS